MIFCEMRNIQAETTNEFDENFYIIPEKINYAVHDLVL